MLEIRSPLYDRTFRRKISKGFKEQALPPNPLLEPAWIAKQVRVPAHLPICIAYQRRPNLQAANPHPLFDTNWYLSQNPAARSHRLGALGHYLEIGEQQGLAPSPLWSPQHGPLSKAIEEANDFLKKRTDRVTSSDHEGKPLAVLFWDSAVEAWAQAQALATADWPYEIAVFIGHQSHPGAKRSPQQPGGGQRADRVFLSAAIALLENLNTSWFFDTHDAAAELPKLLGDSWGWVVTPIGSPSSAAVSAVMKLLSESPGKACEVFVSYPEPRLLETDANNWGEVVVFPASALQEIKGLNTLTSTSIVREAISGASTRRPGVIVAGLEIGDEFAIPPIRTLTKVVESPQQLRWCIKTPVTSPVTKSNWGDTWFAQDLAEALRSLDQLVSIDSQSSQSRITHGLNDVNLFLQGRWQPDLPADGLNLIWLISNPDLANPDELSKADRVFVASHSYTNHLRAVGVMAETLLQCTNPAKFHPSSEAELAERIEPALIKRLKKSVLFVGGARDGGRPIVNDARACKAPLMVFGHGWGTTLTASELIDSHLPNEVLPYFYQAALIVLADHEESMRSNGFISNRIFDAAAVGARVICDYPSGDPYQLEDLFGANVRPYHTLGQLRGLLQDPGSAWPKRQLRFENAAIIGERNSFKARAKVLLKAALTDLARNQRTPVVQNFG